MVGGGGDDGGKSSGGGGNDGGGGRHGGVDECLHINTNVDSIMIAAGLQIFCHCTSKYFNKTYPEHSLTYMHVTSEH